MTEILRRAEASTPLVDVELYGNDHEDVARMLRRLLAELADLDHVVHVCLGNEDPGPETRETPDTLSNILDAHAALSAPDRHARRAAEDT